MGFRFRKSVKIAPGVKVNLGKKSAGISIGSKYGGVSVNSKSGTRAHISAPGTGLSYSTKLGNSQGKATASSNRNQDFSVDLDAASEIPTSDQLHVQARNLRIGLFCAKYLYPILAVLLCLLGLALPICFVFAAAALFLSFKLKKKYAAELPVVTQQAEQLELVRNELLAINAGEQELDRAKAVAAFFSALNQVIDLSITVMEKAPAISEFTDPEECRAAITALYTDKLSDIMAQEAEKTLDHLFTLKTQKGIDASVDRFCAPYEANLDKLTEDQRSDYQEHVAKLRKVHV